MPASLHPASYLKLWDVCDDTIVTTHGALFQGFRLVGLASDATPGDALVQGAESLYEDFKREIPQHALLQFLMVSHGDHSDLWQAYEADSPKESMLRHQRKRCRGYLQALDLRRHDLYAFVGFDRKLTRKEFGRLSAEGHKRRVIETAELADRVRGMLGRAGVLCEPLGNAQLLQLYRVFLNPGAPLGEQRASLGAHDDPRFRHNRTMHVRSMRERLMGSALRWDDDYVRIGMRYHKVLTLDGLPQETAFTLMETFGELKMDFRLSVSVLMPPQERLKASLLRLRTIANATAHYGHLENHGRLQSLGDANDLSQELAESNQQLVMLAAQVVLSDSSRSALESKVRRFQEHVKRKQLVFYEETLAHDREFFKTLPAMSVGLQRHRVVTSNNAVDLLPIFSHPRGDRRPALLLLTKNQEIYSYDPVEPVRDNWNGVVLGASGSGKSVLINMLLATSALGGGGKGRVMVVDFAGEKKSSYLMMARLFGGHYVPVMSHEGVAINPFPPRCSALRADGSLNMESLSLLSAVTDSLLCNDGDDKDSILFRGIVQRAIADVYAQRDGEDAPLYSDLLQVLRGYLHSPARGESSPPFDMGRVRTLVDLLDAVLQGAGARLFNRPTSVSMQEPFIIFDLFGIDILPANVRQAVTCLVSQSVRNRAFDASDPGRKYIFLDEAAQQIRSAGMVGLFQELYDTARKHNTSVWTITQKYADFVTSCFAKTAQTNSTSLFLLDHKKAESARDQIIEDWGLSRREAHLFRSLDSKKGLYSEMLLLTQVWDRYCASRPVSAKLRLLLSPFDYQLVTSDAADREEQRRYLAANPNMPLHQVLDYIGQHPRPQAQVAS